MILDEKSGDLVPDYMDGIPVGSYDRETGKLMLYNHLSIEVKVHLTNTKPFQKRIVGFNVRPMSKKFGDKNIIKCSHTEKYDPLYLEANQNFTWSYCYRTVVSFKT